MQKAVRRYNHRRCAMSGPNIVWITLDSVRSDHTTLDDYDRNTTPQLQKLANKGYGFANTISHGKSTLTSSGAILTGLAPSRNTLGISGRMLPEKVETIAERFDKGGYFTACLSRNSFVSPATGLDKGFSKFQWLASETLLDAGLGNLFKYLLNIRKHSAGFTANTAKHSTPYLMNEIAKTWISDFNKRNSPFFFYLHYNEPHRPYYPPISYLDKFTEDIGQSPREAAETAMDIHENLKQVIANGCQLTDKEWSALSAMYDAEIAYTDYMIGKLVNYIKSNTTKETVFIITADHGELFGEHGLLSHKYVLSDAVTRVPLVIDGLNEGLKVPKDKIIQHSDVMETLLDLAGIDTEETIGRNLFEKSPKFAVSQRGPVDFEDLYQYNKAFDNSAFHSEMLSAIRTEDFRYQKSSEGSDLFHLPNEMEDVKEDFPEATKELDSALETWLDEHGRPIDAGRSRDFSPAVERQLKELGYID